jgi:predicted nucleic acid-binding OB-fold protein
VTYKEFKKFRDEARELAPRLTMHQLSLLIDIYEKKRFELLAKKRQRHRDRGCC